MTKREEQIQEASNELWTNLEIHPHFDRLGINKIEYDEDTWDEAFWQAVIWADEHPKSPWIKCSERMPEEKMYEEDTLQGHRKWTESEQVLVCTSNNTYHTEWTHNGHWTSSQFKGIGGDSYEIVAWMPIPKFNKE